MFRKPCYVQVKGFLKSTIYISGAFSRNSLASRKNPNKMPLRSSDAGIMDQVTCWFSITSREYSLATTTDRLLFRKCKITGTQILSVFM